jgi:hypothetical protein
MGQDRARQLTRPPDQHADRREPVAPADLLARRARSRREDHGPLEDAMTAAQQSRGDLGLDVEAVGFQSQAPRDVGAHDLVAGFHVGERRAVEQVRERRQRAVGRVGHRWRAARAAEESRSVHDAGVPRQNGRHQVGELRRVELQIGILDRQNRTLRLRKPQTDGVTFAAILGRVDDGERTVGRELVEHRAGAVVRPVVHDDDLARNGEWDRFQAREHGRDRRALVVDRNDDGEALGQHGRPAPAASGTRADDIRNPPRNRTCPAPISGRAADGRGRPARGARRAPPRRSLRLAARVADAPVHRGQLGVGGHGPRPRNFERVREFVRERRDAGVERPVGVHAHVHVRRRVCAREDLQRSGPRVVRPRLDVDDQVASIEVGDERRHRG